MSRFAEVLCYAAAKRRVLSRQDGQAGARSANFDRDSYQDWRKTELEQQFFDHFTADDIAGKDVLDFGCGGGELSLLAAENGARSVIGLEVDAQQFELATAKVSVSGLSNKPEIRKSEETTRIELEDASIDTILCFDVLEHILDYRDIIPEWRRVLRPGGHVLIWWMPYYHPWGHHVESLVPLPWVHAVFSDKTVINSCARIYDLPEFKPRVWDLDENGEKKPNKWLHMETLPTLNKLTIRRFEALSRDVGFSFDRREHIPIKSSGPVRTLSSVLSSVPLVREFFTSVAIYDLKKD